MPLNDNHKHCLIATFTHLDRLLADAAAKLGPVEADALFPNCQPDASDTQRQVIEGHLAELRQIMRRFLEDNGVSAERPTVSGVRAVQVAIDFARIDLWELAPQRLAGFGPIDEETADKVERGLADLHVILDRLSNSLSRCATP